MASQNNSIRIKSLNLAKKAIDLCRQIDSSLYTFHGGFTVDPQKLGVKFPRENISIKPKAIQTFINSLIVLVDLAKSNGIKLAVEPNVVQKFNLIRNKNRLLLFAELDEIEILFKFFKKNELGILLDLGHTAVTSHWLHFKKDNFVEISRSGCTWPQIWAHLAIFPPQKCARSTELGQNISKRSSKVFSSSCVI